MADAPQSGSQPELPAQNMTIQRNTSRYRHTNPLTTTAYLTTRLRQPEIVSLAQGSKPPVPHSGIEILEATSATPGRQSQSRPAMDAGTCSSNARSSPSVAMDKEQKSENLAFLERQDVDSESASAGARELLDIEAERQGRAGTELKAENHRALVEEGVQAQTRRREEEYAAEARKQREAREMSVTLIKLQRQQAARLQGHITTEGNQGERLEREPSEDARQQEMAPNRRSAESQQRDDGRREKNEQSLQARQATIQNGSVVESQAPRQEHSADAQPQGRNSKQKNGMSEVRAAAQRQKIGDGLVLQKAERQEKGQGHPTEFTQSLEGGEKEQRALAHQHKMGEVARSRKHDPPPTLNNTIDRAIPRPSPTKEMFGFLKRRRGDDAPRPASLPTSDKSMNGNGNGIVPTINKHGSGAGPGVDAPVSAVNAGERQVLFEYNKSSIYLPVTPNTTPTELIRSASTRLNEPINPKTSILLEDFGKVGVQRPLRKYEHIRDVMNSWDDDRQNRLVLVASATDGNDEDLEVESVPSGAPAETCCQLHYSHKPGKWEKKWITLRSDGQILMAKKDNGTETINVCRLSECDIYTPQSRQLSKIIKPPKKICFAIKSQRKSNMFMSLDNFVHFFATNDKKIAGTWYKAVQAWRSWYLVNVMGAGKKEQKRDLPTRTVGGLPRVRQITGSRDSRYQLGSTEPLLEFDFSSSPAPPNTELTVKRSASSSSRRHIPVTDARTKLSGPPSSFPGKVFPDKEPFLIQDSMFDNAFAPAGLLGRSYTVRQKIPRDRDGKQDGPFTEGPSLLNDIDNAPPHPRLRLDKNDAQRAVSRAGSNTADLRRTPSTKKPKPLIDLTPKYQEPPQHARRGKAFVPDLTEGGALVNAATSPELAIQVPPASDWRVRARDDAPVLEGTRSRLGGNGGVGLQA